MSTRLRWMALGGLLTLALAGGAAIAAVSVGGPRQLADFFFGPHLARAEVVIVMNGGQVHDYRIDRGRLTRLPARTPGSLELRELDGTVLVVPVAPTAQVTINGRPATLSQLGRGMIVTAVRDGSSPAQQVLAEGLRPGRIR
jgi:hypothetical protein